jgi:hypothetical protein
MQRIGVTGADVATNDYHFITTWRLRATLQEVVEAMSDPTELARWWPSVYLAVNEITSGDEHGIGKTFDLHTKGWLPYTLHWQMRVADLQEGRLTITASGDFIGRGIWTAREEPPWTFLSYDWKIRANKPLLQYLSWALKPLFSANHRWAMTQGERSLQHEIERRRAAKEGRVVVDAAPKTTKPVLFVGIIAALGCIYLLARRVGRTR